MNEKNIFTFFIVTLFIMSCTSSNNQTESNNIKAQKIFEQYAQNISNKSDWLSFTIEHKANGEEPWSSNVSFCYKPDQQAFYVNSVSNPIKITHSGYYEYDTDDNRLFMLRHCEGEDIDSPYLSFKSTAECYHPTYLSALFMSPMKDMKPSRRLIFTGVCDTTIRGESCYKLTALTPEIYWTSRRGDSVVEGVSQEMCLFYINKKTEMVDSLVAVEQLDTTRAIRCWSVALKNISFEDKSRFFDSVFDFNSDRFRDFTVYNEYMWSEGVHPSDTVTDEILNFPIVDLKNDTISLKDEDGYVLLNLWTFHCSACIQNLYRYKKQTDSLNYRILEKEGIKIMAINYLSDNMDKIAEIASKTSTCDIIYSAKGMNRYISTPYQGYYYLLSPSKEFIYKTYSFGDSSDDFGDYSKMLEAKRKDESNLKR